MKQQECFDYIADHLHNLIDSDYVLLDLPYFPNVGDILIWQSALDLLKTIPYKCLYSCSKDNYVKPHISESVIIIFMGGGNFGDIWKSHQIFRHKVMTDFPRNRIIQLPQSVCFISNDELVQDAAFFNAHQGSVTICLRDKKSYDIIKRNYQSTTPLLLPDLVLSLDVSDYLVGKPKVSKKCSKKLFVRRTDLEQNSLDYQKMPFYADCVVSDWPTMKKNKMTKKIGKVFRRLLGKKIHSSLMNLIYQKYYKSKMLNVGMKFIQKYDVVYSTRLHAAILATLMGKETVLFDNSYGKCFGVWDLWMKDYSNIRFEESRK